MHKSIKSLLLAGIASMAGAANAVTVGTVPQLAGQVTVGELITPFDFPTASQVVDEGGGTFSYMGNAGDSSWGFQWALTANADPFIAGSLTLTNTTASTQTFNVLLSLPVDTLAGVVDEKGELSLRLTDANGDGGARLTLNQWHGLINPFPPLLDMPLLIGSVFSCGGGPGCQTDLFPPATATQRHGPADHGGKPVDSIGIHMNFDLSPGDTVLLRTRYELNPVPLPASLLLFLSGAAGLFGVSRRRRVPATA